MYGREMSGKICPRGKSREKRPTLVITWYSPADGVVERSESGSECRGVETDTQVDVECDGDGPQERTDARENCQRRV